MKYTPFTKIHESLGAKMVEFAGFYMPMQYKGIQEEHIAVRERVGVFDVSHMGEIYIKGQNALDFAQYVTSNDVSALKDGKIQYSCFPNGKGGIVDDLLVYRINEQEYLLVVNAANIEKDWNWLCSHAPKFNIEIGKDLINESNNIAQLAIQGPLAMKIMQKIVEEPIMDMKHYTWQYVTIANIKDILLSTTGYTGSGGCEIYFDPKHATIIWEAIFEAGKDEEIIPAGLGARDTLRLEMGFCLYGNDIDDTTSPLEAGLGWIVKFVDHKNFIDKEFLLKQKQQGIKRKLIGFEMVDKGIPRHDYPICNDKGDIIGNVTSGTFAPYVKKAIGLGYVPIDFSDPDTEIFINIRNKLTKAKVVTPPFYKPNK
ncbi:MAG: glycine cleavage system aminomethyltransferase GcvT [Bacteroidales bacterium]|jgi:aminomethyltransferase|nr:glycine cleavage system aminomethyltransferase GcvT [Bacteroidales bacterium]MDD3756239.1 glycine cleavage system aminomethyltransferase GcvT [Bacteroidales bacterium]MDI9576185.1 glycine cleavage system aminomethyltransferase GcvT [Bacteroidota bacterium]MDY0401342.1 glycine cleavage system aminomethyltransferase GcvT [Bacteroidales bacterium]HHW59565.1 glycine cleavage system aminomethyltransferase GcvT [Bacteroidales bacterium]